VTSRVDAITRQIVNAQRMIMLHERGPRVDVDVIVYPEADRPGEFYECRFCTLVWCTTRAVFSGRGERVFAGIRRSIQLAHAAQAAHIRLLRFKTDIDEQSRSGCSPETLRIAVKHQSIVGALGRQ
jgi:hypothetical protein